MWQKILAKLTTTVAGGAIIIGLASILSRLLGLVRDNLFAKFYGATAISDIYQASFKVPDLIFNILVLGALSAAFIPVFLEIWQPGKKEEAWETVNSVLNLLVISLLIVGSLAFLITPYLVENLLLAERPQEQQAMCISFMRIMMISIIFFGISNIFSGILNSFRRFLLYSLAPIFYNIGIIIGIIYLSAIFGPIGLAYGVVLGAFLHFLIQLPGVWQCGFRYRFSINWRLSGVKKILKLMPSRSMALGIVQINALIIAALALRLSEGSLAVWTYADNLQNFPINVFGVSLALSAFPIFASAFASRDYNRFKQYFSKNFRRVMFFIIPISIITLLLRAQIVRLVLGSFGSGKFGWEATILTAQTLGFFSLSMFAQATIPILARSFFAQQNTKTPVIISSISLLINVSLGWWLSKTMGIYGLALAFSIANLLNMLMLLASLRVKFGDLDDAVICKSTWKIMFASLSMGLLIQGVKYILAQFVDMHTFIGIFTQTSLSIIAGTLLYLWIAIYYKFAEVKIIYDWLIKAREQIFNGKH